MKAAVDLIDWALFVVLILAVAWMPLLFGSNLPIAWGINALLFSGLVCVFEVSILVRRKPHPVAAQELKIPGILFVAVVLWIVIQNSTWTPSSWHNPIWSLAGDVLGRPLAGSISVDRELTGFALMRLLTAASAFWLTVQLCRDARRAEILVNAIVIIISVYGAYGLAFAVAAPGHVLWLEIPAERGFVVSTFLNRNSFATYAGMGFIAASGLLINHYRLVARTLGASFRFRLASYIENTGVKVMALLGAMSLNVMTLVLTGSRGAVAATALALVVLFFIAFGRPTWTSAMLRAVVILGILFFGVMFVSFDNPIFHSLAERGFYDENRMAVYRVVIQSILDNPLSGYGYGAFADIFPVFRDRSVGGFDRWDMAHDVYLEAFQGLGLVFGLMLMACVIVLVLQCFGGAMSRVRSAMVPCIAACVSVLVGVHALVEFSLQIQAVTLTFVALLGAGVAQSVSSRRMLND